MADKRSRSPLSSRELLERIGLGDEPAPNLLLGDDPLDSPLDDLAAALRDHCERFNARQAFAPGDLVTWKQGMRNRKLPAHGEPAVVLEVLATPVLADEQESGSTYFREPFDIVLGLFVDEGPCRGQLLAWHFDSRRFERWTSGEQSA